MKPSARRRLRDLLFLVLVFVPASAADLSAQGGSGDGGSDAGAIQAHWANLDRLWNARDAEAFSQLFAHDALFTFPDRGTSFAGREAIHAEFAERFPTFAPSVRHRARVDEVRRLAEDLHVIDGTVEIVRAGAGEDDPEEIITSFWIFGVMARDDDGWSIAQLRAVEQRGGAR